MTTQETTATYDAEKEEWLINSPSTLSQKYWITNSAVDAQWCVVFAQTIVNGAQQGIHGFLVPIRDAQHRVCKNVRLEDSQYTQAASHRKLQTLQLGACRIRLHRPRD